MSKEMNQIYQNLPRNLNYTLEGLQQLYGRELTEISKAKPLKSLDRLKEPWKTIAQTAFKFIEESYKKQPTPLTPRQVHYYMVSHHPDIYQNTPKYDKKLNKLILRGRLGGMIQWHWITEAESTVFHISPAGADPKEAIKRALENAKNIVGKNPWDEIRKAVWIFTEKRELGPQLEHIAYQYYVRLVNFRGYGAWTRMYYEHLWIKEFIKKGYQVYAIFVTDHDPSGLDINRLYAAILKNWFKVNIIDIRAMLTIDQIIQYSLPPNPAKVRDPRAKWYRKYFGDISWEVDALGRELMQELLRKTIESILTDQDREIWKKVEETNRKNREETEKLANELLKR